MESKTFNFKKPRMGKQTQILVIAVALLFVGGFLGSSLSGFFIYQPKEESELITCQDDLTEFENINTELESTIESLKGLNKQLADELSNYSLAIAKYDETVAEYEDKLELMRGNLDSRQVNLSEAQSDLTVLEDEMKVVKAKLEEVQKDYDVISQNYANRFCCQLNILGFNYGYYEILGNDVVCLTSGDKEVVC